MFIDVGTFGWVVEGLWLQAMKFTLSKTNILKGVYSNSS